MGALWRFCSTRQAVCARPLCAASAARALALLGLASGV
jgi:hypothetical protein